MVFTHCMAATEPFQKFHKAAAVAAAAMWWHLICCGVIYTLCHSYQSCGVRLASLTQQVYVNGAWSWRGAEYTFRLAGNDLL
jgi:hypothetical protein